MLFWNDAVFLRAFCIRLLSLFLETLFERGDIFFNARKEMFILILLAIYEAFKLC